MVVRCMKLISRANEGIQSIRPIANLSYAIWRHVEIAMNKETNAEAIPRFLRPVLVMDAVVAVIVGVVSVLLDLYTLEAYGTLLVWAGVAVILLACVIGIGGIASRIEDVNAFHLSRAGNLSENLQRVAEAGQSSVGCFALLLLAGISLVTIGYILQIIAAIFG